MSEPKFKAKKQIAALPVLYDRDGRIRVLLITSRETKRLIIPKGWPMKGRKDYRAAAIEAKEEAGVLGRVHRKPIGTYFYWKRRSDRFDFCRVKVFVIEVDRQLLNWREKHQRHGTWLMLDDAIDRVDEPGLVPIIRSLPDILPVVPGKGKGKVEVSDWAGRSTESGKRQD